MTRLGLIFALMTALAAVPPVVFFGSLFAPDPTQAVAIYWWTLPVTSGLLALLAVRHYLKRKSPAPSLSAGFGALLGIGLAMLGGAGLWLFMRPLEWRMLVALVSSALLFVGWYAALTGAVGAVIASWVVLRLERLPRAVRR